MRDSDQQEPDRGLSNAQQEVVIEALKAGHVKTSDVQRYWFKKEARIKKLATTSVKIIKCSTSKSIQVPVKVPIQPTNRKKIANFITYQRNKNPAYFNQSDRPLQVPVCILSSSTASSSSASSFESESRMYSNYNDNNLPIIQNLEQSPHSFIEFEAVYGKMKTRDLANTKFEKEEEEEENKDIRNGHEKNKKDNGHVKNKFEKLHVTTSSSSSSPHKKISCQTLEKQLLSNNNEDEDDNSTSLTLFSQVYTILLEFYQSSSSSFLSASSSTTSSSSSEQMSEHTLDFPSFFQYSLSDLNDAT
mmetsp:Transcript_50264/g.64426  ORF Transcript_50264/g.64426 Transcript_50264/m.64426 type:complete len:303 (+) Transcript_50264:524-1432(+)